MNKYSICIVKRGVFWLFFQILEVIIRLFGMETWRMGGGAVRGGRR
jgi:hypothetical protein